MNTSTRDEIEGTVHEVKGKVKETGGKVTNNLNLEADGNAKKTPAKLRRRSDRSRKCSRSRFGGVCPERVRALDITDIPSLSAQYSGDQRASAWRSEFCTRGPRLSAARTDHTVHGPAPPSLWTINGASARGKHMSDQGTNKSAASEQSQVRLVEMPTPSSISSSDKLLSRIAILLFILVAGVLTVFGYYASSICITVVLAGFLAILFDPRVVKLEILHIPRSLFEQPSSRSLLSHWLISTRVGRNSAGAAYVRTSCR